MANEKSSIGTENPRVESIQFTRAGIVDLKLTASANRNLIIAPVNSEAGADKTMTLGPVQVDQSNFVCQVSTNANHFVFDKKVSIEGGIEVSGGGVILPSGSITEQMLASSSVTEGKIGAGAVSSGKIASNAVAEDKIADGAVSTAKIAETSITSDKILDAAITNAKLASAAVTGSKISDSTITGGKLADLAVSSGKLADGAITNVKLAATSVGTDKIADGAVTAGKLAGSAVTADKIAGSAVTADKIAGLAVTNGKIADAAIATGKIADGAVTGAKIADATIVNAKIQPGTIGADRLDASAKGKLDGALQSSGGSMNGTFNVSSTSTFVFANGSTFQGQLNLHGDLYANAVGDPAGKLWVYDDVKDVWVFLGRLDRDKHSDAYVYGSDARLKQGIVPMPDVLGRIAGLRPVLFEWNETAYRKFSAGIENDYRSKELTAENDEKLWEKERRHIRDKRAGTHRGFIAQELERIFPEWVSEDSEGYKQIDTSELGALLVKAVQELNAEVERLKSEMSALKRERALSAA